MADELFLMQRYWGSDDSDVEVVNTASYNKLNKLIEQAKLKKEKQNSCEIVTLANGCSSESSIPHAVATKKRKKKQKSNQSSTNAITAISAVNGDLHDIQPLLSEVDIDNDSPTVSTKDGPSGKKHKKKHKYSELKFGIVPLINDEEKEPTFLPNSSSIKNTDNQTSNEQKTHYREETEMPEVTLSDQNAHKQDGEMLFPIMKDVLNKTKENVPRSLPDWLANPTRIEIDVRCKEISIYELDFLHKDIQRKLMQNNIKNLFPVQMAVIPWVLQRSLKRLLVRPSDICVSAPTGSGKTLAFVIPIVQSLMTRTVCQIRALVVLPVGDLAMQVYKVFESFCHHTCLCPVLVTGQKSFAQEQTALLKRNTNGITCLADIIVTTPGRLLDHLDKTEGFSLKHLQYLVIDEADRMMEEIQQGWLRKVESAVYKSKQTTCCSCFSLNHTFQKTSTFPSTPCAFGHVSEHLQKLFYSATLSQDPEMLHELCLYRPKLFTSAIEDKVVISTSSTMECDFIGQYTTPRNLIEQYVVCEAAVKPLVISHLIKKNEMKKVICFTQSLKNAHRLQLVLSELLKDVTIRELSSNLRAVQRKIIIEKFACGKVHVLVCSDLMARGMDIENVDCVICYDVPHFIKAYIHRIGRTARAGKNGLALTLVESSEVPNFKKMLISCGKSVPVKVEISNESLSVLETPFKEALTKVSTVITQEKKNLGLKKKGIKKNKAAK